MIDIEDYIQNSSLEFVPSGGDDALILCPFHEESNPSLWVNVKTGQFKCLSGSCGERGGFTKLYAAFESISIQAAREKLRDGESAGDVADAALAALDKDTSKVATRLSYKAFDKFFPSVLDFPEAVQYLQHRKIEDQTLWQQFDLRFAAEGKFKDRIVAPLFDLEGKLVSFAGRAIYKDVIPKTKKAGDSFKNQSLFGLLQLYEEDNTNELVLVEGEYDAMYLQQFGIPAIATMGTSGLSDVQLSLILKTAKHAILCFDGDLAGRKMTKKTHTLLNQFMQCSVILLPGCVEGRIKEGKDPNDLLLDEIYHYFRYFFRRQANV